MVRKYFDPVMGKFLNSQSNLLDYGCGNGFFTKRVAGFCNSVTGIDISEEFIIQAKKDSPINSNFEVIRPELKRIESRYNFDVCLMVDVIHHLESPDSDLEFLSKFFTAGNKLIIFEPNIRNPAIFLIHLLDKNERGLLRFLSKKNYIEILSKYIEVESIQYNGILIGPSNKLTNKIVAIINFKIFKSFMSWLNPKILIIGTFK
jgi:2-polyprenyl-3-methyl-5-hydroxy-6-metoxy-1,4-benzoquinol methylase